MIVFDPKYIREFVADCCIEGPDYQVYWRDLLDAFQEWAKRNGESRTPEAFWKHFAEAMPHLKRERHANNKPGATVLGLCVKGAKSDLPDPSIVRFVRTQCVPAPGSTLSKRSLFSRYLRCEARSGPVWTPEFYDQFVKAAPFVKPSQSRHYFDGVAFTK